MDIDRWFGGSPPDFGTLELGRVDVDSADLRTNRWLASSARRTAEALASNPSHARPSKPGRSREFRADRGGVVAQRGAENRARAARERRGRAGGLEELRREVDDGVDAAELLRELEAHADREAPPERRLARERRPAAAAAARDGPLLGLDGVAERAELRVAARGAPELPERGARLAAAAPPEPVCKSTSELGRRGQT